MENGELYHYGVLGMKWGVRRSRAELVRARGSTSSKGSTSTKKVAAKKTSTPKGTSIPRKSVSEMSDEELSKRIRRLQMEDQYRKLSPEKISAGKKFADILVNNVIIPAGTEAGKQIVRDLLIKSAGKLTGTTSGDKKEKKEKKET